MTVFLYDIGDIIPFFEHTAFEFGKSADSNRSYAGYYYPIHLVLCSSNRSWRFSVRSFGCALFYLTGGCMSKHIQKRSTDITGIELVPGEPNVCLGNGEQGVECCCDECDYYLFCFPESAPKIKEENNHML